MWVLRSNLDPLGEQPVFVTAEPPLWPPFIDISFKFMSYTCVQDTWDSITTQTIQAFKYLKGISISLNQRALVET